MTHCSGLMEISLIFYHEGPFMAVPRQRNIKDGAFSQGLPSRETNQHGTNPKGI